jgi:hypothetical protein
MDRRFAALLAVPSHAAALAAVRRGAGADWPAGCRFPAVFGDCAAGPAASRAQKFPQKVPDEIAALPEPAMAAESFPTNLVRLFQERRVTVRPERHVVGDREEAQVTVCASELTSTDKSADKAASSRLRAHLGERLKSYYERLQQMPASERIQTLVQQLERQMEEGNTAASEADPGASAS